MPAKDEIPSFTFASYARDRAGLLAAAVVCVAALFPCLLIMGVSLQGCVLVAGFVLACFAAPFAGGHVRREAYWRESAAYAQEAGSLTEFSSLVREPAFLEGRIAYQTTEQLARLARADANDRARTARDQREYTELWVHEVKTPLSAARLVAERAGGEDATQLKVELERIDALVEQALFAARSSGVAQDYRIRELSLAQVCREACKKSMRYLIERGVALRFELPDDARVLADEAWLSFIVRQVADNSAKYGANTITFTSWEEEPGTPRGRTVLEIRDDGPGIPAADVPRVFDRGFTGDRGRTGANATGMGLYLVAELCRQMGLSVTLASEEGVGTRVLLTFPQNSTPTPGSVSCDENVRHM